MYFWLAGCLTRNGSGSGRPRAHWVTIATPLALAAPNALNAALMAALNALNALNALMDAPNLLTAALMTALTALNALHALTGFLLTAALMTH